MRATTVAEELAAHIVDLDLASLPREVVARARDALLDQLGCELIGSTMPWLAPYRDVVAAFGGRSEASLVGSATRTTAHDAAFVNATFGQGCELDDVLRDHEGRTCGHPGAMTVPVALALGERDHLRGADVLAAVVAGYETDLRLGQAMTGSFQRGFHNQTTLGPFAAAAVASRLMGLDRERTAHALAIAGSHASGTMEYDQSGGEVKRMHAGLAARAGIQSAAFAKAGVTGPLTIFEGKRGILHCFAGDDPPEAARALRRPFGPDFGVMRAGHKLLPVVSNLQSPIMLLGRIVAEHGFGPKDVERIDVGLSEHSVMHGATIAEPSDAIGAQSSLAFSLALRMLEGRNDLRSYADPRLWRDPAILALAHRVGAHADPRFHGGADRGSHVRVTLRDGRVFEASEDHPKGVPERPVTHGELVSKFRELAAPVLGGVRAEEVIRAVDGILELEDAGELVGVLRAPAT